MKFNFFTFGGRFFWEDIYNYRNWIIQKNVISTNYRLIDPYDIKRDYGTFDQCKATLLRYIAACEEAPLSTDSIILIPGFAQSKKSLRTLATAFNNNDSNVIIFNHASICRGLSYHANALAQFLRNVNTTGILSFITIGTGGLILRKMLANSNNYRSFHIKRILEINPLNSGSDFAELLSGFGLIKNYVGPMVYDITPQKVLSLAKLPPDIEHGIIFCPFAWQMFCKGILAKYESFPSIHRESEESFAPNIKKIDNYHPSPLKDDEIIELCRNFINDGAFDLDDNTEDENKS